MSNAFCKSLADSGNSLLLSKLRMLHSLYETFLFVISTYKRRTLLTAYAHLK